MLVKKLGVNALLPMSCRLRFSKSLQSDNHVYSDLNNSTSDFFLFKVCSILGWLVKVSIDACWDFFNVSRSLLVISSTRNNL